MADSKPRQDSLVLYKSRPARVMQAGAKLALVLDNGKTVNVRPKDVTLLHPGPLRSLTSLTEPTGDLETAWELLAGETTTLPELAELVFDEFTPATAWATWQYLADGLYFQGTPDAITVNSVDEVAQASAARAAKAAEKEAWQTFIERVGQGRMLPDDDRFLTEVEQVALGQLDKSRVLREIGNSETPEAAHALLLRLGYWDHTTNPYPHRLNLPVTSPTLSLPDLPGEARLDLTPLPAFAIDDEGSTDPDDAISLDGNRLWVHVADVAALITPDSPLDLEARARGANLYLPEHTVHMLPEAATGVLALGLADVSPALSFGLDFGDDGQIDSVEIKPSLIKVERLSYEQAEVRLSQEPLKSLVALAERYKAQRMANQAIEIDLPEVKVRVVDGQVIIHPIPDLNSRSLVREAMLMAGEAVARFALASEIPFPFTTQDLPNELDQPIPDGMAGMFARRLAMKPGQVKSLSGSHAGLGLDLYSRVTSPLRRYLDLVAHQQLRAYLHGESLLTEAEMLERVGAAEAIGGDVRRAERQANRHWTLVYFMQNPGWEGEAVLIDRRGRRGTFLIPSLAFETRLNLRKDLPLNSVVTLAVRSVNLPELEASFRLKYK